jgi:hypothetical protein
MSDKKNSIVASAMNYGIALGLFWMFEYLFVILGDYFELSKYLHSILQVGTPVVCYLALCSYRNKERGGSIDFGDAILFTLFLFLFASLFEILIICIHIYVVNPATSVLVEFSNAMAAGVQMSGRMLGADAQVQKETLELYTSNIRVMYLIFNLINNFIYSIFFALIIGFIVSRINTNKS